MLSQVHAPTQSLMSPFGTRAGAVQMEKKFLPHLISLKNDQNEYLPKGVEWIGGGLSFPNFRLEGLFNTFYLILICRSRINHVSN